MVGANDVYAALENPRVKTIITAHMDAYHSGAQGGDYFYLYKYYSMWAGSSYKMFGYALHRARPRRFFTEGASYIREKGSDSLKAFFYGYITHYCFDYLMHPAINAICPNAMKEHNTLEYGIDTMYAHARGIDAVEFDRAQFVRGTHVPGDEISAFFDVMMKKLYYGFRLKPNSYHTTYGYFEKYNRKMYKPDEKQRRWMKLQNKFTMLDLFTMLYYPYEQVKDLFDYRPYFELIEKAVQKSLYYIDIVDAFLNGERDSSVLASEFFNVNFNGLPVTPREERLPFRRLYRKAKLKL
ncbi:MAG TPA: hypothetical protein DEB31_01405, partial [Clostridiales bacterium]|nr:hypothetical protein [Clostridiales bacterium]